MTEARERRLPWWAHGLMFLVRIPVYATLAVAVAAVACTAWLQLSGHCPEFNEAVITCDTPQHTDLATFCLGVFMLYAFTGVPALVALLGLALGMVDCALLAWCGWRGLRRLGR